MVDPGAWPNWLVDGSQVAGAGIGTVALIVALVALSRADTTAARERRIAYELDLLREMRALLRRDRLKDMAELHAMLLMLQDPADLPLTRAAVGARPRQSDLKTFAENYPRVPPIDDDGTVDWTRFKMVHSDGTFHREWLEALTRRLSD
ncbi:hypothetical protein LWC33_28250 [Pseudonocardia sp. RS11V-5]|uniref:hypothetical protein n=1 Tax=Pseudonocardia terrae TaxID=2905831 RepID=UPI001E3099D9|nr:hypothetical protein [Pseudonocardia terrae]MCE3555331.1 hypothetical protein [Pseudonocardia terrae]